MSTTTVPSNRFATGSSARGGAGAAGPDVPEAGAAGAKAGKKKGGVLKSKKALLSVVLVLAAGGGGYTFFAPHKPVPPTGGDVVAMDATTLNLADGHYLKIAVAIQLVKGKASSTSFASSHAAELTIDEFSNRTVDALSSNAARKKLTADLLAKVQAAYPGEVYDVFLTQFVTQ